jgi:hypothetical protein
MLVADAGTAGCILASRAPRSHGSDQDHPERALRENRFGPICASE